MKKNWIKARQDTDLAAVTFVKSFDLNNNQKVKNTIPDSRNILQKERFLHFKMR